MIMIKALKGILCIGKEGDSESKKIIDGEVFSLRN